MNGISLYNLGMSTYYAEKFHTLGKRIEARMLALDMNQTDVYTQMRQRGAQVSRSFISQLVNDKRSISVENLAILAKVLDTTADHLLLLSDNPEQVESAEPTYYSEEADIIAQMIDAMPLGMRTVMVQIVRLVLDAEMQRIDEEIASLLQVVENSVGREARRQVEAAMSTNGAAHA